VNREQANALVAPFYAALNSPASKDVRALVESVAAPEWRSFSGEQISKGREEFIQQVMGFGKLMPDLAWDVKQVLVDGDCIVVRSEARGTPVGPLFGVPASGRTFRIMTLDLHTVRDGKLVSAHHVEDWAGAIRQLGGR
jgi:steroid delta-isomerase-like uncharacterized protein